MSVANEQTKLLKWLNSTYKTVNLNTYIGVSHYQRNDKPTAVALIMRITCALEYGQLGENMFSVYFH